MTAPSQRPVLIALIVAVASFMQMLDSAVIATAIPRMAESFAVTPMDLGIGITIYVLTAALVIPASAWLADRVGARRLFVGALLAFVVTSVLCGASRTLTEFIAARFLQGIAGGLMGPTGQIIMMRAVKREDMLRVTTIWSAPMLVAPVIGPPLGGLITTFWDWPWIFYLNVPVGLAGAVLAQMLLPATQGAASRFDLKGFLLNAGAFAPLLYGLGELGSHTFPRAVALLLVAVGIGFGYLAIRHALRAPAPILPLTPARSFTFRVTTFTGTPLVRLPITALPFVLPILFQVGFGFSAFASGMLLLAHTAGDLVMKLFTTPAFRRFGFRNTLLVCVVGMALSMAACAFFSAETPLAVMALVLFLSGAFRSFLMTGLMTLSLADIPRAIMPAATTINQVMSQAVTAVAIALTTVVLELSINLRGDAGAVVSPFDCRVAIVAISLLSLLALGPFSRLKRDAGAQLSGHRPKQAIAADAS